jgi:lambda family phage minor tail protein L
MSDMDETVQLFAPGEMVVLFELDCSFVGGPVYHFTSTAYSTEAIVFDGVTYVPIDVEADGFECSGQGSLPTPKIRLSNANQVVNSAVITYSDLIGATFTRIRTFKQFLDDGDTPNPAAVMPLDIYKIERKVNQNKVFIEWELSASIDQAGKKLPGRQVLKDACTHIYRRYVDGDFDYSKATCPYVDTNYFTRIDEDTTNPALDQCGKRLTSCRLRFGEHGKLPTRSFPGIGDQF